jgi:hypothetical protein
VWQLLPVLSHHPLGCFVFFVKLCLMYDICCLAADTLASFHNDDSLGSEAHASAGYGFVTSQTASEAAALAVAPEERLRQVARNVNSFFHNVIADSSCYSPHRVSGAR